MPSLRPLVCGGTSMRRQCRRRPASYTFISACQKVVVHVGDPPTRNIVKRSMLYDVVWGPICRDAFLSSRCGLVVYQALEGLLDTPQLTG